MKAKILHGTNEIAKGAIATSINDNYKDSVFIDCSCDGFSPESIESMLQPSTDLVLFLNVPNYFNYEAWSKMILSGIILKKPGYSSFYIKPDFVFITREKPDLSPKAFYLELIEVENKRRQIQSSY